MSRIPKSPAQQLRRLYDLMGAAWILATVHRFAASPRAKGTPGRKPANTGDMLSVWRAVEYLRITRGYSQREAFTTLEFHCKDKFRRERGYGVASLRRLYRLGSAHLKSHPVTRLLIERDLADLVTRTRHIPGYVDLPVRYSSWPRLKWNDSDDNASG